MEKRLHEEAIKAFKPLFPLTLGGKEGTWDFQGGATNLPRSTRVPSFFARLLAGAAILPQGRASAAAPGWRRLQGTWPFCGVLYVRGRGHDSLSPGAIFLLCSFWRASNEQ